MSEKRNVHFPETRWTLVARLHSGDPGEARRAMDDLLSQYRYALYAFIRRRGLSHHDAEDVLHDFLVKLMNVKGWLTIESKRGRLRGFLSASLGHFLSNWKRDENRRGKLGQGMPCAPGGSDEERYANEQFSQDETAEEMFERQWGDALMARVMEELRKKCEARGQGQLFTALQPVLAGGGSLRGHDAEAIAAGLGMNEGTLRVALMRHLRDFRKLLEQEVEQTVESPRDIGDEIAHLMAVFASSRGSSDAPRGNAARG